MNDILRLILSLSLSGSIVALVLFGIKPFIRHRLSKSIQYYIWIIVLLRFTLPFSIEESIMNKIFYNDGLQPQIILDKEVQLIGEEGIKQNGLSRISHKKENAIDEIRSPNVASSRYPKGIQRSAYYVFYTYVLGGIITLAINLIDYSKFIRNLNLKNKEATYEEGLLLNSLVKGKSKVDLLRNPFINTPILIGIFNPKIIIPDREYNERQLKNILNHELTHLRRFDIGIKWITMITKSIHWFNPMIYMIEKEINHACELSCDEAVIKNLDNNEKQSYGETLISIVSEEKDFRGKLQVTMNDNKDTLKDRLIAIMNYSKKSRTNMLVSGILILAIIISSLYLGAGTRKSNIDNMDKDGIANTSTNTNTNIPTEPPLIVINSGTNIDVIENYTALKTKWNGNIYDRISFYQPALNGVPNILADITQLANGEEITVDFGQFKPEMVLVKMAYLTRNYTEALLPIEDISVIYGGDGIYKFTNPEISADHIKTTGRAFSIEAIWGDNICEYVFVVDRKPDNNLAEIEWIPVELDMKKLEELQKTIGDEKKNSFIAISAEFIDSLGFSSENTDRIRIEHNSDNKIIRYEFKDIAKAIESKVVQPIKNGIDGIWVVDSYRIEQISD